ncbi:hypothetical protein FB451DRAFT_1565314 [Mycena latifolia]|nr:hypothetical protein FB451DRAFT_1565314 [Mycena latifolia]
MRDGLRLRHAQRLPEAWGSSSISGLRRTDDVVKRTTMTAAQMATTRPRRADPSGLSSRDASLTHSRPCSVLRSTRKHPREARLHPVLLKITFSPSRFSCRGIWSTGCASLEGTFLYSRTLLRGVVPRRWRAPAHERRTVPARRVLNAELHAARCMGAVRDTIASRRPCEAAVMSPLEPARY